MAEPAMPAAGRLSLRRSITVISALLDLRHAAATNGSGGGGGGVFELREERGYTSIRDLIVTMPPAAAIHSAATAHVSGEWRFCEIPIRNRLVKLAARAYLQPMAVMVKASGSPSQWEAFRRFWDAISCGLTLGSCFDFVRRLIGAI